ncbi:hypothetical protein HC023_26405 [Streptomyces sp. NEAU-H3]|nr:hypothetical protein [Streptomyces sp. NEAU-H3]
MNAVVSDYLPKAVRGPVRAGLLGCTIVTFVGLTKLNFVGPGITGAVCGMWERPAKN